MIFYFSGTGNTLDVAERIAKITEDKVYKITEAENLSKEETVGVFYPVYFSGLPIPVKEFFENYDFSGVKYLYAVATYGGSMGGADGQIAKILKNRNLTLNASFGVVMPDNYLPMFNPPTEAEAQRIIEKAIPDIEAIGEKIKNRENTEILSGLGGKIANATMYKMYLNGRKTDKFYATDSCVKCGLCAKNCPSEGIEISDTVKWIKERCYFCMGCINRCPQKAIQYGEGTGNKGRYVNPVLK